MSGIIGGTGSRSGVIGFGRNEPAFHVQGDGTTATLCIKGEYQLINFPTVTLDTGGFYVTGTDRYVPTDGVGRYYHVTAHVKIDTTTTYDPMWVNIYKDGSGIANTRHQMNSNTSYEVSTVTWLNGSTSYLEVKFYQNGAANRNTQTGIADLYFNGFALSLN